MSTHKTFVGKILSVVGKAAKDVIELLGSVFKHVVEGAEETFNNLPEDVQLALIHGSGIMEVIKLMLDKTPAEIRAAILEKYPDLNEQELETGLFALAHFFNLAPEENNLDDCIAKLTAYLASKQDVAWKDAMHAGSLLLAAILAPAGTKFEAFTTLIEYVFLIYIQPLFQK